MTLLFFFCVTISIESNRYVCMYIHIYIYIMQWIQELIDCVLFPEDLHACLSGDVEIELRIAAVQALRALVPAFPAAWPGTVRCVRRWFFRIPRSLWNGWHKLSKLSDNHENMGGFIIALLTSKMFRILSGWQAVRGLLQSVSLEDTEDCGNSLCGWSRNMCKPRAATAQMVRWPQEELRLAAIQALKEAVQSSQWVHVTWTYVDNQSDRHWKRIWNWIRLESVYPLWVSWTWRQTMVQNAG